MSPEEIIEKKQSLVNNDIAHYNKRMDEIENEICVLKRKKNAIQQKISKKQIYFNQLDNDKSNN